MSMFCCIQQHLIVIMVSALLHSSRANSNIQTIPNLTNNVFAYGLDNLTLTINFEKAYIVCQWVIRNKTNEELGVDSTIIYEPDGFCNEPPLCVEKEDGGVTFVTSQLTIQNPITYDVYADVECNPSIVIASWIGSATNCSSKLPDFVNVISSSTSYGSKGRYSCENGGELFYSNGTYLTSSSTICLYDATWEGQKDLECQTVSSDAQNNIQTIPNLTNNTFTCGFDNLTLKAKFEKKTYIGCQWIISNKTIEELGVDSTIIFSPVGCNKPPLCVEEEDDDEVTFITSQLTIRNPINYDVHASILCDFSNLLATWIGSPKCLVIETIPYLPNGIFSFGLNPLTVKATFENKNYSVCEWAFTGIIPHDLGVEHLVIFNGLLSCFFSNICNQTIIDATTYIVSELTISKPIIFDIDAFVACNYFEIMEHFEATAKNCSDNIETGAIIQYLDVPGYNSSGVFKCPADKILFSQNGTLLNEHNTVCLYSAKWREEEEMQCWAAPSVSLLGDKTISEGQNLTLKCEYFNVFPPGNQSIFFWKEMSYSLYENFDFTIKNLSKYDDKKPIYCQALTPFTEVFNEAGRSPTYYTNVLYKPYQELYTRCHWIVNTTDSCLIQFQSNPLSTFISLSKKETDSEVDGNYNLFNNGSATQVFIFSKTQVLHEDNGTYVIALSSTFGYTTLSFDIIIDDETSNSNATPSNNSSLIAAVITVSCIAAVLLTIAVIVIFKYIQLSTKYQKNLSSTYFPDNVYENPKELTTTSSKYNKNLPMTKTNESSSEYITPNSNENIQNENSPSFTQTNSSMRQNKEIKTSPSNNYENSSVMKKSEHVYETSINFYKNGQ